MKYLDFLDDSEPLTIALIEDKLPEETKPIAVVEKILEFIDHLFDNIFWKSYYENIKENN
jgi:hypothetical protein